MIATPLTTVTLAWTATAAVGLSPGAASVALVAVVVISIRHRAARDA